MTRIWMLFDKNWSQRAGQVIVDFLGELVLEPLLRFCLSAKHWPEGGRAKEVSEVAKVFFERSKLGSEAICPVFSLFCKKAARQLTSSGKIEDQRTSKQCKKSR